MAAEVEDFVRGLDLSNLTHAIVKEKFKKHIKKDSLTKEEKMQLKQAVEKVLLENEDDESSDDDVPLSVKAELLRKEKCRKRARDSNGGDGKVNGRTQRTKKTRTHSPSSDSGKGKRGVRAQRASTSPAPSDSEEEEEGGGGDPQQSPPPPDQRAAGRLEEEEEARESDSTGRSSKPRRQDESGSGDSDQGVSRRSRDSEGEESSGGENQLSDTGRGTESAQGEQEERDAESSPSDESSGSEKSGSVGNREDGAQGASSTDSSSESEEDGEADGVKGQRRRGRGDNKNNTKRKAQPKERRQDEHPTLKRLKRYIVACGVRRNYKKLFADCRTDKSRIRVLRTELEELGIKGNPSLEKCKALRFKRDEEAELASLDVANIIHSEGRPRRRRGTAWEQDPIRPESYKRTLPSDSDEEQEERPRKLTMWSNLQGLISDDCESD